MMSMFNNTSQSVFQGGQFANILHGDAHFHVGDPKASSKRGLDLLHQNVAIGAFYDAAERGDPPKCYPQTRLAIIAEIQEWVQDPEVRKSFIMWVYGPAGAGKSAIAQTIAELFAKRGLLASFFFSRTGIGRNDTTCFIASIAYQLCISVPEARGYIAAAVEEDPLVFSRTLLSQMEALIVQPLNAAAANLAPANLFQPRLVIIDGLDEAREETNQKELIEALTAAIEQLHNPLIFLIASRPEYAIRQAFNTHLEQSLIHRLALDEDYKPDDDIRIFFFAKFNEIRKSHPSGNILPVPWPSKKDVDYLIRKASGQFIYASTVMKYIISPRDNPKKQLKIILGLSDPGKHTPFAQLDALYHHILSSVNDISRVLEILALLSLQTGYYQHLSVEFIDILLGYDSGDTTAALTDMHALVHVPLADSSEDDNKLRMYHASLFDFLLDRSRSERFFLDVKVRHADIARCLLHYITTPPKNEYKEHRFRSVLDGFISHYLEASPTKELVADLNNFSLTALLSNITMQTFCFVDWDVFFNHLRSTCGEANIDLHPRLIDEFDNWIRDRYERYPEFIQPLISAAQSIPGSYANAVCFLPDIFNILTYSLSHSHAISLRKLDRELFQFQYTSFMAHASYNDRSTLQNFFSDPSRAGIHLSDAVKSGNLVGEIVKVLCRRDKDDLVIMVENRKYNDEFDSHESERFSTLKLQYGDLPYFPDILDTASEDPKLAKLLWELAVQYQDDDAIGRGRVIMADACLRYIKRCGINIPEHVHQANCAICANYKPMFSTLSPKPEDETAEYTNGMSSSSRLLTPRNLSSPTSTMTPISQLPQPTAKYPQPLSNGVAVSADELPQQQPSRGNTSKKPIWKRIWRR